MKNSSLCFLMAVTILCIGVTIYTLIRSEDYFDEREIIRVNLAGGFTAIDLNNNEIHQIISIANEAIRGRVKKSNASTFSEESDYDIVVYLNTGKIAYLYLYNSGKIEIDGELARPPYHQYKKIRDLIIMIYKSRGYEVH